jgi:hypothetical protein
MASINANGDIQLEQGDVIPRAVAVRTDDPPHIVEFISQVNPTIHSADDLAQAIAHVDTMRAEWLKQHGEEVVPAIHDDTPQDAAKGR